FDTEIVYRYVQVEAGKYYQFGYDGARLDNQGGDGYYAPKIGLLVDGQEVIAPRDMPYGWQYYQGVYHATETKVVRVAVVNKTSSGSGNDFALDNIGIKPVSVEELKPQIENAVDDVGSVTGNVSNNGITDDKTPTLKGTGVPGAVIEIQYGKSGEPWGPAGTATVDANGNWTFTSPELTSNGVWEYRARTVIGAENSAWTDKFVLNVVGNVDAIGDQGNIWNFNDGTLQGWTTAGKYASDNEAYVKKWSGPNNSYELGSATGNGAVSGFDTEIVYRYVQVEAGKYYQFGYDGARLDNQGGDGYYAPKIGLLVDGQEVIAPRDMPYGWQYYQGVYHATETKVVRVAVVNKTSSGSGNDFALDNIGIKPVSAETVAPEIQHVIDNFGSVTGNISNNGITDDKTPTLKGKGVPGAVIEIEYGKEFAPWGLAGTTIVDANGNWTFSSPTLSSSGTWEYRARTVKGSEKGSWSEEFRLIVVNSDTFIIGDRAQVWNFNDGTLQGWKKYGKYNKGNEIQVKPWSGSGNSNEVGSYTNDKTTSGYNGDVIYRDVLVEKGQVYQLEFDAKRVENWHSAPKLGIKIDGQQVIPHTTLNGSWKHLVGQYVATETKVVKVAITSGVATGNGNDFTLDNIGIKALAPAQTDAELNPNGKSGRSALFELIDQQSDSHAVDLTNDTHNTVDVDIATLLQHGEDNLFIEDGKTQMRITGDSEDTVRLDTLLDGQTAEGTWAQQNGTLTVAGVAYNVYSHSGAEVEVLVQEGVKTEFM
ncbi:Ig-like domain-containing protein, partial [Pantoea sp.]|uniref:Ig-like domain-containing protein n=1 Tax=Pantoea sp. TaxID=69393 RepID=UPI0031CE8DAD